MVRFEGVGLRYGAGPLIFRDVTFDLAPGSFHFLTGRSGSGKTSLLRLMYLAARPSHGRVRLFGRDTAGLDRDETALLRRRFGVVFQDFRLLPHLSALDNVALPLRVAGEPEREIRQNVIELLRWVGLERHLHARPHTLSGGQQQRVAIARAVVGRPELLVADEPTGNVDNRIAIRLMYMFDELNRNGTTIVIATHNEQLVAQKKHPRLHMFDGRVVAR